jgi:hypothetical protein
MGKRASDMLAHPWEHSVELKKAFVFDTVRLGENLVQSLEFRVSDGADGSFWA